MSPCPIFHPPPNYYSTLPLFGGFRFLIQLALFFTGFASADSTQHGLEIFEGGKNCQGIPKSELEFATQQAFGLSHCECSGV